MKTPDENAYGIRSTNPKMNGGKMQTAVPCEPCESEDEDMDEAEDGEDESGS